MKAPGHYQSSAHRVPEAMQTLTSPPNTALHPHLLTAISSPFYNVRGRRFQILRNQLLQKPALPSTLRTKAFRAGKHRSMCPEGTPSDTASAPPESSPCSRDVGVFNPSRHCSRCSFNRRCRAHPSARGTVPSFSWSVERPNFSGQRHPSSPFPPAALSLLCFY